MAGRIKRFVRGVQDMVTGRPAPYRGPHESLADREKTRHAEYADRVRTRHEGFWNTIKSIWGFGQNMYSTSFYQVTVGVKGGPQADIRRLWWLACATAFGRYTASRLAAIRNHTINADWDITEKEVTITISYTQTGIFNGLLNKGFDGITLLKHGPSQETTGANWPVELLASTPTTVLASAVADLSPDAAGGALRGIGGVFGLEGLVDAGIRAVNGYAGDEAKRIAAALAPPLGGSLSIIRPLNQTATGFLVTRQSPMKGVAPTKYPLTPFWDYRTGGIVRGGTSGSTGAAIGDGGYLQQYRSHSIGPKANDEANDYLVPISPRLNFTLPDAGRVITTGNRNVTFISQPKPSADGISRVHPLQMIVAALSNPGFAATGQESDNSTLAMHQSGGVSQADTVGPVDDNINGVTAAADDVVDQAALVDQLAADLNPPVAPIRAGGRAGFTPDYSKWPKGTTIGDGSGQLPLSFFPPR